MKRIFNFIMREEMRFGKGTVKSHIVLVKEPESTSGFGKPYKALTESCSSIKEVEENIKLIMKDLRLVKKQAEDEFRMLAASKAKAAEEKAAAIAWEEGKARRAKERAKKAEEEGPVKIGK